MIGADIGPISTPQELLRRIGGLDWRRSGLRLRINARLTHGPCAGMNPAGAEMTRLMIAISLLVLAACADGAVEQPHPEGHLHHPEGVCVLGEQVHVISSNHDRRYQSGAVFSYVKAEFVAGTAAHTVLSLPAGFGGVLNLGACVAAAGEVAGYLLLIDRVTRTMLKVEAAADGALSCASGCLPVALGGKDDDGVMTGILDPGRAVTLGDHLLFSSRIDEQATL